MTSDFSPQFKYVIVHIHLHSSPSTKNYINILKRLLLKLFFKENWRVIVFSETTGLAKTFYQQAFCKVDSIMDSPSKNMFDQVKFRSDLPVQYLRDVW